MTDISWPILPLNMSHVSEHASTQHGLEGTRTHSQGRSPQSPLCSSSMAQICVHYLHTVDRDVDHAYNFIFLLWGVRMTELTSLIPQCFLSTTHPPLLRPVNPAYLDGVGAGTPQGGSTTVSGKCHKHCVGSAERVPRGPCGLCRVKSLSQDKLA